MAGPLGALALAADAEITRQVEDAGRHRRVAMSERSGKHMRLSGTNLERAGDHNQRVTLHAIRVNGPITRAELAVITGLTAPAIANITKRLLTDNLIQDAGRRRGGRGQPATKLVINPDSWFSIGLNIDRDHITMVVLDFEGRVRARASREVEFRAARRTCEQFFTKGVGKLLTKVGIGREPAGGHRRRAARRHAAAADAAASAGQLRRLGVDRRGLAASRACTCRCSSRTMPPPRPWARCSSASARNTRLSSTS